MTLPAHGTSPDGPPDHLNLIETWGSFIARLGRGASRTLACHLFGRVAAVRLRTLYLSLLKCLALPPEHPGYSSEPLRYNLRQAITI
jgi:hypothetical protein